MIRSRRLLSIPLTTLSVLFASVILFGGTAHAESLAPVPLSEGTKIVQQQESEMEEKAKTLTLTDQEIAQLQQKKTELAQTLENEKKLIEELKVKIAEKKRVAAIRAEEQARLASYQTVRENQSYIPPTKRYAGNSSGNTYVAGQCTWHVKNMKPELPNLLGNANMWFYNARAQGWPTGYVARAGAAAQTKSGMHVAYVLEVYGNGTMLISEMNISGPYSQRNAVVPQSNYLYIY